MTMTDVRAQLEDAQALVERLKRQVAGGHCREVGCDMEHIGGCNAGCGEDCCCSVPVHVCPKCGDSDYGDNPEAAQVRDECRRFGRGRDQ